MPSFETYIEELLRWKGLPQINLIRPWKPGETIAVENAIQAAVKNSQIVGMEIPKFTGSNQAKGNKAADFFIATISPSLPANSRMEKASGKGYPDRLLVMGATPHFMELKATANWRNSDTNRRVLTSSPTKMISLVGEPQKYVPTHLICTVLYSDMTSTVQGVRLDFIEPDSQVNIRLEASTSQRLLTLGAQKTFILP